jgi:hypothetical protein
MNGSELLVGIASALGAALVTVLIFVFSVVSRLARVEVTLGMINTKLDSLERTRPTCPFHSEIDRQLAVSTQRLVAVEKAADLAER